MAGDHDRASGTLAAAAGAPAAARPRDLLSDVLQAVRLSGALFFVVDAGSSWAAPIPDGASLAPVLLPRAQHVVSYHIVTAGTCSCQLPGAPPLALGAGDILVVPHGDAYVMTSGPAGSAEPGAPEDVLAWFGEMAAGRLDPLVTEGAVEGERLGLVCGFLGCDGLPFNPVLAALPRQLLVRGVGPGDRLGDLIDLAVAEVRNTAPGTHAVLPRIAELMFVEVLRRHLRGVGAASGWLAGLRDPIVGRALAELHARPEHHWTLEALAHASATSRTVLVERFTHLVGQPPMQYLAQWRLQLAAGRLLERGTKVAAVAREVGYESEAAFSRAFKRRTGESPAAWRARHGR